MKLYLLRHAIAVDPGTFGGADEDRPLSDEGVELAQQVAEALPALAHGLSRIYHSPFIRARQTAEAVGASFPQVLAEALPELALGGDMSRLRRRISEMSADPRLKSVLFVGHQPELDELASLLVPEHDTPIKFRPATLCCFEVRPSEDATLLWLRRAEDL